jgi:hypothetical protein
MFPNAADDPDSPFDTLVPDPQVRRELGNISEMTTNRWDRDPRMAEMGWPPKIKIRERNFRGRRLFEAFKHELAIRALHDRARAHQLAAQHPDTTRAAPKHGKGRNRKYSRNKRP